MQHLPAGPVPPGSPGAAASDPPSLCRSAPGPPGCSAGPAGGAKPWVAPGSQGKRLGSGCSLAEPQQLCAAGAAAGGGGTGGTSLIFCPASASPVGPRCGKVTALPSRQEGPSSLSLLLLVPAFKFLPNEFP